MQTEWIENAEWVKKHVHQEDMKWAVKAAQALVQMEPQNPPGNELPAALWAEKQLKDAGLDVKLDIFGENRANIIATYGNTDDIGIILYGHIDTIPIFGKFNKPQGCLEDGFLHGRGSSDMLSGCAAIMAAARVIAGSGFKGSKGMMVVLVSDEEQFNAGMKRIFNEGKPDNIKIKADVAIVAEPTDLRALLGNRGFTSFYIRTKGKAVHSSAPHLGENAIYKMAPILDRLQQFCKDLEKDSHKWLGSSTLNVGTIMGGILLNTVPDSCQIEVERRILPGTTPDMAYDDFRRLVGSDGEVVRRSTLYPSWIDENHELVLAALKAVETFTSEEASVGAFTGCTEAGYFSELTGIPTILLGPGSLSQAHRENEFCQVKQIEECVGVFTALAHLYMK